ncbi:hypothetical protein SADUNF_Sadunf17G0079500 [Salix dunnii]|uniref:Uncharacterized protein n=1 Tax=Salix dunnii TaxID=1413687 RepID=A0A835J608_9ROSI|nr:hypothetical protein SADUNF_Sadunf17G0079500 [Salix dunnii]
MVSLCLAVKDLSENDSKKVRKENQTLELDALEPSCKVGSQDYYALIGYQLLDVGSLYFDVICDSIAKKEISSAALVLDESMDSLFYDANEDIENSFRNDLKSPGYFSFQQELPETESKGSSMIRESNVKFFSTRTPLSTASPWDIPGLRVEVNEVDTVKDENLLATESKPAEVKMYQRIQWGVLFNKSLISSCSDDHAANDVLEVENHDLSRDDCGQSEYTSICSELLAQESQPQEEMIASPDKENQRPLKFLQKTKLGMPASKNQVKFKQDMVLEDCKAEGVPLQSLLVSFSGNSISVPNDTTRNGISNCSQIMRKSNLAEDGKRWTVVADTASLVGKESRKSLHLLQGLKGTHLVITKMVSGLSFAL